MVYYLSSPPKVTYGMPVEEMLAGKNLMMLIGIPIAVALIFAIGVVAAKSKPVSLRESEDDEASLNKGKVAGATIGLALGTALLVALVMRYAL